MRPKVLLFVKQQQLSLLSNLYRNCVQTLSNVCVENAARALYFRVLDVFSFLAMLSSSNSDSQTPDFLIRFTYCIHCFHAGLKFLLFFCLVPLLQSLAYFYLTVHIVSWLENCTHIRMRITT